jgi:hypothetical protein
VGVVAEEVPDAAAEATIPALALAHSAVTRNRKSITKTTIYCVAMYMKMAKSVHAAKLATVPNTNARWLSPSSEHVTWRCFPSLAKYCARLSL